MSQFTVTYSRENKVSEDPASPHFDNQPVSTMIVSVRATTPAGAEKVALAHWAQWDDFNRDEWKMVSVMDEDADPE